MLEKDQMIRRCIKEYRGESMNYIMFLDIQWSRVYMNFFDIMTINFAGGNSIRKFIIASYKPRCF